MIETKTLTKQYGPLTALGACNLSVGRGEVFGLLGPNGAGKTTLIRLLMGFLRPTRGAAFVDGRDCQRESLAVRRLTAYLPGEARLFRRMPGRDVLRFFSRVRADGNFARALDLAERLDLRLAGRVSSMSTGMRQKLVLAAVFSIDSPLLILDEPTTNLDPTVRNTVAALVGEARQAGRTVLLSSHVLSEVEQTCDRVAILRRGELVHVQVMSELRRRHRIRARLTGPPPDVPASLAESVSLRSTANDALALETTDELAPLLGWLATLPVAEVRIEPVGLAAVYDRFHAESAA